MYYPETTSYTGPVVTSEDLLRCLPDQSAQDMVREPDVQLLTIKTCNAPALLDRCLGSFTPDLPGYVQPVVVDDSKADCFRDKNKVVAREWGAEYFPVSGEESVVKEFADYLDRILPVSEKDVVIGYLHRITRNYHRAPPLGEWGGVAGAQNVGHLASAMTFGARNIQRRDWLATFIDDDLLSPPNAEDIFRMQRVYRNLGNVSVIASHYLHHPANPLALTVGGIKYIARHYHEMSDEELDKEFDDLLHRVPAHGLRTADASAPFYSTPARTLTFPLGNYTLVGDKAYDIPVPIVGMNDVGYCELLQLFEGAGNLGVARVPDFIHERTVRPNGGDATSDLAALYTNPEKETDHAPFHAIVRQYAIDVEGVSKGNIDDLNQWLSERKDRTLKQTDELIDMINTLSKTQRFASHRSLLSCVRDGFMRAKTIFEGRAESSLDPVFARKLITDMRQHHPRLIQAAYAFGAER